MTISRRACEAALEEQGFKVGRDGGRVIGSRRTSGPPNVLAIVSFPAVGEASLYLGLPTGGVCAGVPSIQELNNVLSYYAPRPEPGAQDRL